MTLLLQIVTPTKKKILLNHHKIEYQLIPPWSLSIHTLTKVCNKKFFSFSLIIDLFFTSRLPSSSAVNYPRFSSLQLSPSTIQKPCLKNVNKQPESYYNSITVPKIPPLQAEQLLDCIACPTEVGGWNWHIGKW